MIAIVRGMVIMVVMLMVMMMMIVMVVIMIVVMVVMVVGVTAVARLLPVHISNRQLAVQYAALHLNLRMQLSQLGEEAADRNNFETLVAIHMDVHVRYNLPVKPVLEVHKQQRQLPYVMIVHHHDRSGDDLLGQQTPRLQQRLAHQIANRFGAVCIALFGCVLIELLD
jgi:methionine synthase I (cobalamin-dependent)